MASYLDIHPLDGVIEIGGTWFAPDLQRTRMATETLFLLFCCAMDRLGYRRMQRRLGLRFERIFHGQSKPACSAGTEKSSSCRGPNWFAEAL